MNPPLVRYTHHEGQEHVTRQGLPDFKTKAELFHCRMLFHPHNHSWPLFKKKALIAFCSYLSQHLVWVLVGFFVRIVCDSNCWLMHVIWNPSAVSIVGGSSAKIFYFLKTNTLIPDFAVVAKPEHPDPITTTSKTSWHAGRWTIVSWDERPSEKRFVALCFE